MEPTTKLAILQAYPLGSLDVVVLDTFERKAFHGRTGRLYALVTLEQDEDEPGKETELACLRFDDVTSVRVPVKHVLPTGLRPFSALCTPLPNGEVPGRELVPVVEVAKLAVARAVAKEAVWGGYGFEVGNSAAYADYRYRNEERRVRIFETFDVSNDGEDHCNQAAILDKLRSWHFAVGLDSTAYIPL